MNEFYKSWLSDSQIQTSFLASILVLLVGLLLSYIIPKVSRNILSTFTARTTSDLDDYILKNVTKSARPIGIIISISLAWDILLLGGEGHEGLKGIDNFLNIVINFIFLLIIVRLANKLILKIIHSWSKRIDDQAFSSMLRSIAPMIRALIWCIGVLFYLQNIGVQMAAIWALLSAGGIGAGLALKEPVQEFFEYITILLDKPFQNGQFINVEGIWASVERVGVRSTRLRSINGEVIVVSNSSLTNGVISNYAEMDYRRLVHKIGVIYDTSVQKIEKVPGLIKEIIEETEDAIFDRCHFTDFSDFSLDFEFVYYIPTNDYLRAMDAQQQINIGIMKIFESEDIEFAYPTQTIHLGKDVKR